ncbi:hypothetical protein ES703_112123 [subsurface metagenome]
MSDELTDKVKLQIEEILERTEKPVFDVEALVHRTVEILEERFPSFLAAIVLAALEEQLAKYNRGVPCKHFTGSMRCEKGKMIGEACLSCDDYKPAKRFGRRK